DAETRVFLALSAEKADMSAPKLNAADAGAQAVVVAVDVKESAEVPNEDENAASELELGGMEAGLESNVNGAGEPKLAGGCGCELLLKSKLVGTATGGEMALDS